MDTKEPIKISLSTAILSFIILILIIVIILLAFSKNNNNENQNNLITNNNIQNEVSKNQEKEPVKTSLDVNSVQIKNLYSYIPAVDENKIEKNAYQSKKITSNELSNEYKLMYAFQKLELKDTDKQPFDDEMDISTGWYTFNADILQNKVKEIFGNSVNIQNSSFEIGYGAGCNYSNGKYAYSVGGGSGESMQNIRKIQEAYQENDVIYIIDKYMILQNNEEKNVLYGDSDSIQLISKIDSTIMQEEQEKISEKLIDKYYENMKEYKHTFKKNIDGTYYWYSTEPIK